MNIIKSVDFVFEIIKSVQDNSDVMSIRPNGVVSNTSVAKFVIRDINPDIPDPQTPFVNFKEWELIVEMFSPEVFTNLAESNEFPLLNDAFVLFSYRFDDSSPFIIEDLFNVDCGPNTGEDEELHAYNVLEYSMHVLPPVTAGLINIWLGSVRMFDRGYYYEEILPDGVEWPALNKPYKGEIQVSIKNSLHCFTPDSHEPKTTRNHGCVILHELGHVVHSIYGFYRPGSEGYDYPSDRYSLESSGHMHQLELSSYQEEFIMELFKSYGQNHLESTRNIRYNEYGNAHPAEAFACAFEKYAREGLDIIDSEYPQFSTILRFLV